MSKRALDARLACYFRPALALAAGAAVSLALPATADARRLPKDLNEKELIEYLSDGGEDARAEACHRLGKRKSRSAVKPISKTALKDGSAKVRKQCLEALEEIGSKDGLNAAHKAALTDENDEVRVAAIDVIKRLDGDKTGGATLAKILRDKSASLRVRRTAADVIGDRRWRSGADALARTVRSDEPLELRRECLKALVLVGDKRSYDIVHDTLLKDPSVEMRREASWVLERHPDRSSLGPLCKALRDSDDKVVANAVDALLRLGNRKAVPALREAAATAKDKLAKKMNSVADRLER